MVHWELCYGMAVGCWGEPESEAGSGLIISLILLGSLAYVQDKLATPSFLGGYVRLVFALRERVVDVSYSNSLEVQDA